MPRVLVPLAPGFEELEAITITDLLVRAGVNVITASLDGKAVTASRGTTVIAKAPIDQVKDEVFDLLVLPGGLPGANFLRDNETVQYLIKRHDQQHKTLAAICAAPKALAQAGVLQGKTVTCYPGSLDDSPQQPKQIKNTAIEIDGNIITSRGPGTAMDFALLLIEKLLGREKRDAVEKQLVRE